MNASPSSNKNTRPLDALLDASAVERIRRKIPVDWSEGDVSAILAFAMLPFDDNDGISEGLILMGLRWSANNQNTTALPMLAKLIFLYVNVPEQLLSTVLAIRREFSKRSASPECRTAYYIARHPETWAMKVEEVAVLVHSKEFPVTAKVVEHARERLRSIKPLWGSHNHFGGMSRFSPKI